MSFLPELTRFPTRPDTLWIWLNASLILMAAILIAGVWSISAARHEREERLILSHAETMQRNLIGVVSENLRQILDRSSDYGRLADAWLAGDQTASQRMMEQVSNDRVFSRPFLFDRHGREIHSAPGTRLDGEMRVEIENVLASDGREPRLVMKIGPMSSQLGEAWQTPLIILRRNTGDRSIGALVLFLDLGYLLRVYRQVDIGATGVIHVASDRGIELARSRRGGMELITPGTRSIALSLLPETPETFVRSESDGSALRMSTIMRLSRYPFSVSVSQEVGEILASVRERNARDRGVLVAITIAVILLTIATISMVRRQRRNTVVLRQSEREKQQLIEQLRAEKSRANELASHDHLTGLFNRRMFMEVAGGLLAQARRGRKHAAVLFLDLDRFKPVNDTLGHKVGDQLLKRVAVRLTGIVRESDVVARIGGDEFVILLTGLAEEADVDTIAQNVVDSIGRPYENVEGQEVRIGTSVGIALYPRDGQELDRLIRHADDAMYQSKRSGPGRYQYFDPALNTTSAEDFELEQRIPTAIASGEFILYYQPKVDLRGFGISGFEALVRWQHPTHGLIFPGRFLPLAERIGQMAALDSAVIDMACRQLADWLTRFPQAVPVAINLSPERLQDTRVVDQILERLAANGVPPSLLHVEITENTLVSSYDRLRSTLNRLAEAGIKVALDDFGNGYAGLNQVRELPIDIVKIDRSFIRDILNSHDDKIIVESSITLAHKLGLRVIAEGVETREQLTHLKTAGCDEVQGYLFSRPVAVDAVEAMLRDPFMKP